MASHPLDYLNDSRAWEVISVTTLSLCSLSICSCIFFFIIVYLRFGQIVVFLVSVARDRLRFKLELRRNDYHVCFKVANYDIAIVFCNFNLNNWLF